jgi:hypothetical protein
MAPAAKVYQVVIDELKALDGAEVSARYVSTAEAGKILGVAPKTAARWAKEGRVAGARKTSSKDGKRTGEWRIPAGSAYTLLSRKTHEKVSEPRLWRASDG